ncbi:aromatic-ring-hydroxylating dioxygenase subunit beta [Caballeronia udeis]|uniref:Aromatic-ring-hydroxylating dioxygenase subunit beta n=1 Tax=Caballeronia udeis TaxID=1232866 RepID=A0A158JQ52_9BURK|nr:aromatic-ring-hydroxylating dioxygenase subunit beta [Caballeronia udeis]SAL70561.1 aromatic-ring-hydroxylating dioxygenase subunit beta [Caballeronia udeis]
MKNDIQILTKSRTPHPRFEELRSFIEAEADLLDEQLFEEWCNLYAEDAVYWVPAQRGQESWTTHVSLYYDDKHTMKTRVQRLNHSMTHCQEPESQCVRVVSGVRLQGVSDDGSLFLVRSKFFMLEDRPDKPQRVFGGNYVHTLRTHGEDFQIVQKRVELTNCDQSFPNLSQPF